MTKPDFEQLELELYGEPQDPRDRSPLDMVKEFAKVTDQVPDPDLYSNLIEEEYFEWLDEVEKYGSAHQPELELKELADLVYVIYGYANAKRWDLDEAVRRVHDNNVGRCIQPDGSVKRRDDGKIIKNKSYPKVELKDLV